MKKCIAIPVENGKLCTHFGHCEQFALFEIENNKIVYENSVVPPPNEPFILPAWIAKKGVTDIIAGGIGQKAIVLLNAERINVFIGAPVKSPKVLVDDFICDKLAVCANYCDH